MCFMYFQHKSPFYLLIIEFLAILLTVMTFLDYEMNPNQSKLQKNNLQYDFLTQILQQIIVSLFQAFKLLYHITRFYIIIFII